MNPLVHVPPETVPVSVTELPVQTEDGPERVPAEAGTSTDMIFVAVAVPQLFVAVYDIVVVPAAMPDTIPDVPTVATDVLLLLHEPPEVVLARVMELPTQPADGPVMLPADAAITVTTLVAAPLMPATV